MSWPIFLALFAGAVAILCAFMLMAWVVEQRSGNAGWVDTFWSFGMGAAAVIGSLAALAAGAGLRAVLVAVLVAAWSIRLGSHVALRSAAVNDDPRYAKLRKQWGTQAPAMMFKFLQVQAFFGALLVMSVIVAAWNPSQQFRLQDALAILVLVIAVAGEALADWQLRRFRANPANRGCICEEGMWRYSRHPNYFFEWMVWLAWPIFAIDFTGGYHWGLFALIAPVCMYWLLNSVSGIPPLEDVMSEKYGARYREYQQRTSAFFPMPPGART